MPAPQRARNVLLCLVAFVALWASPAQAQSIQSATSYLTDTGLIPNTVISGLDATGKPWPCGLPNVVYGCGLGVAPLTATSTVISGTVAAANTFQLAVTANASRRGCLVLNKSTSPLMVALATPGAATPAASIMLAPGTATADGGRMNCAVGSGVVVSDPISVTSTTAGAAFLVIWQ